MSTPPFQRLANPFVLPVGPDTAGNEMMIADDPRFPKNATSFLFVNPNPFWVRLRGTQPGQTFTPVTATTGWLFPPGFFGVFKTQNPKSVSVMAVAKPGYPLTDENGQPYTGCTVELAYGGGA